MTVLRGLARSSTALLSSDALARVILFLTTVYVARVLGPGPFGLVTFAQALLGYFLLAADWGLSTYGVREIATRPGQGRDVWAALSALRLAIAILLVLVAAVALERTTLEPGARSVVLLTLLSTIPIAAIPDWVARGFGRMGSAGLLIALPPALALLGILALVGRPQDVERVPLARLVAAIATAVLGSWWLASRLGGRRPDVAGWLRGHGLGRLLASGSVLLLANAAVLAYNSADQLLLKILRGDHAVGIYGSAYRVIQVPTAALYAVTATALPMLTRLWRDDPAGARHLVGRLSVAVAVAGLTLAAGLWLLRGPLVRLLYGEAYAEAGQALGILAFAVPLDFVASVRGTSYVAAGRERGTLLCVVLAGLTNVVANLIAIPRGGMIAAAWVTLGSYAVLLLAYALIMERGS